MLFSTGSLFPQKKGAVYSFVLLVAVALLVIGILSVSGVTTTNPQTFTPRWVQASAANASINITITNSAGENMRRVDITKLGTVANFECGANMPGTWTCSKQSASVIRFDDGTGVAAGSSASFNINITPPATGGNYSFTIDSYAAGGANVSTTYANSSVDNDFPYVKLVNVSDGTNVLSGAAVNGLFFLKNASKGLVFVINATDNASGMETGTVAIYYNLSTLGTSNLNPLLIDYRNASTTNVSTFTATNGSFGQTNLYNVTLNISAMAALNGTKIGFIILANDSVRNGNVSNSSTSAPVSTYVYNFTIDAAAPQFVDAQLSNGSQVNTQAINTTSTAGSGGVEYIINSSLLLNLSVLVRDDGGSGTVKVEVMNRTGGFMLMDLLTGTNASAGQTTWTVNATANVSGGNGAYNITDLINQSFAGDGKYNITFRATDNVSNNAMYNFTIEVDDTPPTGSVVSNISIASTSILSVGNTTQTNTSFNNTAFVLRVQASTNINTNTTNISVFGNLGKVFNLTFESGTPSGTAYWNLTVKAGTSVNATEFCTFGSTASTFGPDASTCNFRFNFSDVLGRFNDTINLTVYVDSNAPAVTAILRPESLTTNYSTSALVNVSVNDTVGPLQNVSFRIRQLGGIDEGLYSGTAVNISNVTNWIPVSLGTGNNSQPANGGTWNFTINLTALNFTDGNYSVEVNATDSAGRQNASVAVANVIFDSSKPQNISIVALATNSFWIANFTVGLNATERASGLLNVSVRLENGTHNSFWVGVNQVVSALASVINAGETVKFNASTFNLTHVGGWATNATNGNFTLRLNVTDTAGNQNTSVTINFTIDTIVPAVSFVYPLNNRNQTGNFTINASVTESNINLVQFRWENGTITQGNSNNGTFGNNPMTYSAAEGRANATFTNLTDGSLPLMFDSNYTIRLNVTDKAGNMNDTVYIQLVLDKTQPTVIAIGPGANSQQTGDFLVNMTFNDNLTVAGTSAASLVNSTNINASAFRLENNTFNSSWFSILQASTDFAAGNVDRNRTNATFTFTNVANGRYDIRFWVNDTAGNQNSAVLITNVTLDNVAPNVTASVVNVTPAPSGSTGSSGTITFNVSVTDNLPLNISITNNTQAQTTTYGVFYRFENSTHNLSWISMSTTNFENRVHNNTGNEHRATFNASNTTTTLADGDYNIRINVTDRANNQNISGAISITVQNGGTSLRTYNFTFLGGFVSGSDTNRTSPTLLLNTSENSTCLYSLDTPADYYDTMLPQTSSNTMGNNVSRQHSKALGFLPDRAANGYATYYACKDVSGNFSSPLGAVTLRTFSIDSRNFFNITMGSAGTNKVRGDYFAVGWNSFTLPKTTLLSNTGVPTTYNITNVLSSLGSSTLAAANFTVIYSYNGSDWASYRVGGGGNTFSNFTADTPTATYYLNITVANERLEIN